MATTAFDLSTAAEVLWSSKPTKVSMKGAAVRKLWHGEKAALCSHTLSYLRRQSVSVVDPVAWLSPLRAEESPPGLRGQKGVEEPGRSRLMSQKGSIVVETPL